jgi:hypothetical protein
MGDDLGDHRIVVGRDDRLRAAGGVDGCRARRDVERPIFPGKGELSVLGVDPALMAWPWA